MARGADFYGPGVLHSTLGQRVIVPALRGKPTSLVRRLDLPPTYTVIDDFGETMAILGKRDEALRQAWHVPNPHEQAVRATLSWYRKHLEKDHK